MNGNEGA